MYRILIAEDNTLIRKGIISTIDWAGLDCQLIGEAENGYQATELLEQYLPDILITDIRMPIMDGLQLLDHVSRNFPHMQTLVISGYENFDYVRYAMQHASIDYLLKPIRRDDINRAISRACQKLNQQSVLQDPDQLRLTVLRDAMQGFYSDQLPIRVQEFQAAVCFCVITFQIPPNKHPLLPQMLVGSMQSQEGLTCYLIPNRLCHELVLQFTSEQAYYRLPKHLEQLSQALESAIADKFFLGCSAPCKKLSELARCRSQAHLAFLQHLLYPKTSVLYWSDSLDQPDNLLSTQEEQKLSHLLLSGDAPQTVELCTALLDTSTCTQFKNTITLQARLLQIYCLLAQPESDCQIEIQQEIARFSPDYLFQFYTFEQIIDCVSSFCRRICNNLLASRGDLSTLIESVRQYMETHYDAHITLPFLADLFHISPAYLSQIFKRQYGIGLNRCLRDIRLRAACQMLQEESTKLSDISLQCGFRDYVHFSKTFKDVIGSTPSEFRKQYH